jgi:hypothetical protein
MSSHMKKIHSPLHMTTLMWFCHRNGLFRFDAFSYIVGDFLFDTFQVLLHFRYSSTELHNGLIDFFLACFKNGDVEAWSLMNTNWNLIFFGSCMEYMMWLRIFQRCGCMHL